MSNKQTNDNIIGRDAFVEVASRMQTQDVTIPEIGTVRLRAMTCGARDKFLRDCLDDVIKSSEERQHLLQRCIIDEGGDLMFAEDEIDVIAGMSHRVLEKLTDVAQTINWMGVNAIEDAEKNSGTDRD